LAGAGKSYAHGTSIEAAFRALAEQRDWKVWRSGWPDFLIASDDGGVQFVEVKSAEDRLRDGQIEMFTALERAGISVKVWWERNPTVLMSWRLFMVASGETKKPPPKPKVRHKKLPLRKRGPRNDRAREPVRHTIEVSARFDR
jgi:hypothetical protein